MAYTMKKNIANKANYGGKRALSSVKWIVIHYTANDGDTDENNGKYFHNNVVKASSNYFVDSDSITECVPDEYAAYAVGGSKYNNAGGKYYGKCTNSNSISIELCDDVKDGKIYPSAKTIENAIAFTKLKMKEFGINADHVIRHYDVNGKLCPAYWCGSDTKDKKWKSEFWNKLSGVVNNKEDKTETNKKETSSAKTVNYKVKINTASGVNVRKGPGENYSKITAVANGKTTTITKEQDGWGYAKEYAGWICLKYTKKLTASTSTKKDNDIAELQQECNKQGYSNQKIDGIPGPNTLAGCPTVKKGAKGNITKWIQKRLISLGYSCGSSGVDGDFGSGTEKAVKNFQKEHGLTADGIVGKDTWKKLLGM